jgi:hypothetical protein
MIDLQVSPLMYGVLPKHDLVGMWAIDPNWIPIGEGGGTQRARHPQYIMSLLSCFENHDFLY